MIKHKEAEDRARSIGDAAATQVHRQERVAWGGILKKLEATIEAHRVWDEQARLESCGHRDVSAQSNGHWC